MAPSDFTFCVAPMMDWTDRHCRYLHRLLSRRARLYTEMVAADAVIHGDRARLLAFDPAEHPVALQLGGADPVALAEAARIGEAAGYDEINLNVGCPSDRVQSGRFGACLMAEPDLVARGVASMVRAVTVPVTVKCRIGIDDQDSEQALSDFAVRQRDAGAAVLIVHARKAWLKGLSPKENRDIPPLDYDRVYRLKAQFPDWTIVINGGIGSLEEARAHLAHVDGAMLGRAAYDRPAILADVDRELFGATRPDIEIGAIVEAFAPYVERQMAHGTPLPAMTRHMLGLVHGRPGARAWRRHLTEAARQPGADVRVLGEALDLVGAPSESGERRAA